MDLENAAWELTPAPGEPTAAGPGTETKILAMIQRAMRREPLFHPLDGMCQKMRQPLTLVSALMEHLESA
jgi:hypothetical protein